MLAAALAPLACATGAGTPLKDTVLWPGDFEDRGYDVLAHHRELLVFGDRIAFRGGADLGGDNERYVEPWLIVNNHRDTGDATTVLRQIPVENIARIRLLYAHQVPPELRRPRASGGIISITTRDGKTPAG